MRIPDDWMYVNDRQLTPFRVHEVSEPHIFCFEPVDSLSAPEGKLEVLLPDMRIYREDECYIRYIGTTDEGWEKAYLRISYGEKVNHAQVKVSKQHAQIGVKTVLNSMAAEHLVVESGGFIFHCAFIECAGKAILFTAPSGTGKSTQAELWNAHRGTRIINGDRAAVCIKNEQITAEGIPFSGSSAYCDNGSLPLAAIVYLSQAPQTSIRQLYGMDAFFKIWEGISVNSWVKEDVNRVSEAVQKIAEQIPVYHLSCTPDETGVCVLEDVLRKQGIV